MLYEKKMLILSGDGKGVVLIEKSAGGVRFSLRTFDMPTCDVLKAGIITRTSVYVRDLPSGVNPAATFTIDAGDISTLHFAVFDKRLRLYGTNSKRMWEANIMDLLCKNDRRAPNLNPVTAPALPPIAPTPRVLPMPDGTGIPQSRLALYGDEALAETDFYTPLDIESRMSVVDNFLDSPRVLDGLAPRVVPPPNISASEISEETTAAAIEQDGDDNVAESSVERAEQENEEIEVTATADAEAPPEPNAESSDTPVKNSESASEEYASFTVDEADKEQASTVVDVESTANDVLPLRADDGAEMPWEITARWLKNRTKRAPMVRQERVRKIPDNANVKFLRASSFFERARADIELLFKNAEPDKTLTRLLPDMVWVKVEFDGRAISVGRGGNEFLCYAVLGTYEKISPLGDEAQWLPLERSVPTGKGYWLIFQNLSTGDIIG